MTLPIAVFVSESHSSMSVHWRCGAKNFASVGTCLHSHWILHEPSKSFAKLGALFLYSQICTLSTLLLPVLRRVISVIDTIGLIDAFSFVRACVLSVRLVRPISLWHS